MTYQYFLRKNNLKDSVESYTLYNEKTNNIYGYMNDLMKKQYIDVTFPLRFTKPEL